MLAFTFPGQGSQKPGMGAPWRDHPSWELVDDASDVVGRDVAKLLLDADADELKLPRNTQLATYMLSLVVLDAVERTGVQPSLAAGHSLGEYTALTATGCLTFDDGVRIVSARGDAMQSASDEHPGSMTALLGIDDDDADAACRRADGDVWVANYNAPGQVVIAGAIDALERASAAAKDLGAKRAMPLAVGGAFHTPYMAPARERLREVLAGATFHDLDVPVIANIDARPHGAAEEWPSLLSAQLVSPVRWRQSVQRMAELGATTLIELGPGGVLSGMAKRIAGDLRSVSVATPDDIDKLLALLNGPDAVVLQVHEGEHLYMHERMVVAPTAGVFAPDAHAADGQRVEVGGLLGRIGDVDVRSSFSGEIRGMLAVSGERVTTGQPIAWLTTA